jgi:hypothetical protein
VPGSDDALTLLIEGEAYAQQEANKKDPNQSPLPMSTPIRLRLVEEILAGPSNPPVLAATPEGEGIQRILQERANYRGNQASPTNMEDLHPRYPYQENIDNNDDLPQAHYPHPYLAAQVNQSNRDPRILGRAEKGAATYDEGPLMAQPMEVVENDIKDEVVMYPIGENVYLDSDFLQAMGTLNDRGLAADGLHLVQLDGEFRNLEQWEKCLTKREQDVHLERGDLIQRKHVTLTRQTEVYKRLQKAKAASWLTPLLPNRLEGPGLAFLQPTQPYTHPA